jgi:hypothetical protein
MEKRKHSKFSGIFIKIVGLAHTYCCDGWTDGRKQYDFN